METKFLISKCSLIPSEGSSLKENYDIVRGNPIIDYYESVESPSIAMTITFVDIDQVIGREGITGGEYVDVTVKIDGFDDFKIIVLFLFPYVRFYYVDIIVVPNRPLHSLVFYKGYRGPPNLTLINSEVNFYGQIYQFYLWSGGDGGP